MASNEDGSISSRSSRSSNRYEFDVFICFRGADTRQGLTSHLHEALRRSRIRTFCDEFDQVRRGEEVVPQLLRAIGSSAISIIVFSENFAFSTWCLDEVEIIRQQKEGYNQKVLPLFYGVEPSDVRRQAGSFAAAFDGHKHRPYDPHRIQTWREALKEVADLRGFLYENFSFRSEANFVNEVVREVEMILEYQVVKVYDVFMSFRGSDTRRGFADHLYHALKRYRIRTYRDDNELERGESLNPQLENAIKNSDISIIIFSPNFASSRWCLDEVVMILDQKRHFNQRVLPVFYRVDPYEVRHQVGSFKEAFTDHESNVHERAEKIEAWKSGLREVADFSGMHYNNGYETEFIDQIVKDIEKKMLEIRRNFT